MRGLNAIQKKRRIMTEKRFALIIANCEYEDADLHQLVSPAHDAESLVSVLKDPAIGGFDVQTLLNKPSHKIRIGIEEFFTDRKRDELLLLFFSGHGIKDEDGQLYFSSTDTKRKLLRATSIEANFVNKVMQLSRSRKQVLILDCCYSGAFARGMLAKADKEIGTKERFEGMGRVVLTASDAMQYAFEGDRVEGEGRPSVFTRSLVHGLETGEADRDGDGQITLDELYDYVHDLVTNETPNQRPSKWNFGVQGKIIIARSPNTVLKTVELPNGLHDAIENPLAEIRKGAVRELGRIMRGRNKGLVLSAHKELERMKGDDSRRVSDEATKILVKFEEMLTVKKTDEKKPIANEKSEDVQLMKDEKPAISKPKFRSIPKENLSERVVKLMLKDKGFFDSGLNKSASGFSNDYKLQSEYEVVYDHAGGLMWQQYGSDKYMTYEKAKAYVA